MPKRSCCPQYTLALLFLLTLSVQSAEPLWRRVGSVVSKPGDAGRWIRPQRFHPVELDPNTLRDSLSRTPQEFTPAAAVTTTVIEFPMPDGSLARFRVCESPIMAPELAAQFPEIKTYSGQGLDDPSATIRFDATPAGVHAQILSPGGTVYIDPYRQGDATLHQSYYRRDYQRDMDGFTCLTDAQARPDFQPAAAPLGLVQSGGTLRTFRLAVSATGEYTQFHGGTVAAGLAAIVSAVNRVNGIYETELAIRLVLAANNHLIVFTNAATDPFSNNNPNSLLTQNQATIDSLIGSANYDVGHCFSTGGGGLSLLSSICRSSSKAQSVTGLSMPVGDAYLVDYVAHEIAHEFGASHSFNGVEFNCASQISPAAAYEPGSGSTIMGYAGICGNDNLQAHSDPYFHFVTVAEIQYSVTVGLGSFCGVASATGNTPPSVNAGPDFNIPRETPFTLTATGNDLNGDPLTYCWEQRDLGPAQSLAAPDSGSGPLFRSFPPSTNSSRTFPKLFDILNHTATLGEKMPAVSRSLNFRVTARDKRSGGGGVTTDDMMVNVVESAGPFQVTEPNTAVSWSGTGTVTWAVAETTASPIDAATVDILLSTNGGASFPIVLAAATPNDGSESIVLPNLATSSARIKVRATDNIFFDINDANFTIIPPPPAPQVVADSTSLLAEACLPANGLVDPDEVVTVSFALKNIGTGPTTNLHVSLLASGSVVPLSGLQNFGVLTPGGPAVARSFTFLPIGSCSSNISATLQLLDGDAVLSPVLNQFTLGTVTATTNTYVNANPISIPTRNVATPYPSTITIPDLTNPITKLTLTVSNLSHTEPDDLDILLVGPGGQSVLLMSDVGGGGTLNNATLVFDDAAPAPIPDGGPVATGTWSPTNIGVDETFSPPAPAGPYGATLSVFNGLSPEGVWSLYVYDDFNQNSGSIAGGWALTIQTQGPACCGNASPPELDISDARVTEGDVGTINAQFDLILSRPISQAVTVFYYTSDGSAMADSDFIGTNGSVQFSPGQTHRVVRVAVLGDAIGETNELFAVTLTEPSHAMLGRSTGFGTIVDDEVQLSGVTLLGTDLVLQFNTLTGRTYRVERTDFLSGTNFWTIVPGAELLPGNGGLVPVVDTNALSQPQRFYRVRQLAP